MRIEKIKKRIKQIIITTLNGTPKPVSLLNEFYGHNLSKIQKKPIDRKGFVIPWYTYPAIDFLDQFDFSRKDIFEWGSGNSSLYFSKKARSVTSIEHDRAWYDLVVSQLQANQKVHYKELESYPSAIKESSQKFDVIIIDGQRRFDCALESFEFLNKEGIIILDNSDWFHASAAYLREKLGLLQVDFHGFGPINDYTWTTSVFFTRNFNFPLLGTKQPKNPYGGLLHDEIETIKNEDNTFKTKNYSRVINNFNA